MLRPSTAPRWKIATRTLRRPAAASTARNRKRGGAASATRAQAPDFTNVRRVIMWCLRSFHRSPRPSTGLRLARHRAISPLASPRGASRLALPSPPLEFRRAENERQQLLDVGVGRPTVVAGEPRDFGGVELRREDRVSLGGDVAVEDRGEQRLEHRGRPAAVGAGGEGRKVDADTGKALMR